MHDHEAWSEATARVGDVLQEKEMSSVPARRRLLPSSYLDFSSRLPLRCLCLSPEVTRHNATNAPSSPLRHLFSP